LVETSATNVLRSRIDQFGVVSPNIQVLKDKDGQILLELPGVKDHDRVRELLTASAALEFYSTYKRENRQEAFDALAQLDKVYAEDPANAGKKSLMSYLTNGNVNRSVLGYASSEIIIASVDSILEYGKERQILPADMELRWSVKPEKETDKATKKETIYGYGLYVLQSTNGKPALDGDCVADASTGYDDFKGNTVSMKMNSEGAKAWARVTGANVGNQIAIVLDNRVYSAPNVNEAIEGGSSEITGDFSLEEAKDLANVLKSGKMTAKVEVVSEMVIGPSLGQQAINAGFISFIVALVLLMIFMMAYYGVIPGLVANFALICNLFFTFGILSSFQAVLTMSGIAGIVLALGMAVDANVLIFERTKEELRAGKNVRAAIADGYSNAFSAIFDSNLTSIITGVILMYFGTGPIKGFATTLIIGIVCSFFTAVYLSRLVFVWWGKTKAFQKLTFTTGLSKNVFVNANYNFLGARKIGFSICAAFIVIVIASFFLKGLNQGIDFSGGRNYVAKFEQSVDPVKLQEALAPEFEGASVSVITIENSNQVRISTNYKIENDDASVDKEIADKLFKVLKPYLREGMTAQEFSTTDANQGIISSQKVGPTVADDMRTSAIIAVIISLIAMFLYILLRFRNVAFSVGALAAVAFTAFSIIGVYSISWGWLPFAMEVDQNFIAAILTIIGYQINDTVVVFDRVRENVGLYPKQDFFTTINKSINSTLGRTVMTSGTTLLVLLCIFILGGDAIRSFVFAMLLGVIIGTLATMFVAAPVAYLTDARRNTKKASK
jgi:SecD/SecF fusion protein